MNTKQEATMGEPRTIGEVVDQLPTPRDKLPATVTPSQMLAMAIERGGSMEMLERLMALQERYEAAEARKAFVAALSGFKANPPTVVKNREASFGTKGGSGGTSYEYVTLDRLCDVIGAGLAKHGLSHRWEVAQDDKAMISVTCVLTHNLGHSERVTLKAGADGSGSKNSIQAIGSAVTYLERYSLLAATGLAARSQDDDAHAGDGDPISAEQKEELVGLIRETATDTKAFLKYLGMPEGSAIDDIPSLGFGNAKAALEQKRKKKGAAA